MSGGSQCGAEPGRRVGVGRAAGGGRRDALLARRAGARRGRGEDEQEQQQERRQAGSHRRIVPDRTPEGAHPVALGQSRFSAKNVATGLALKFSIAA